MLHLVRHARTEANAGGRLQGRLDLSLDEVGRAQAAALRTLVPEPVLLVSSPSRRAIETAAVFGVTPRLDDRWLEMDYGILDGTLLSEIPAALWQQWRSDHSFAPEGGESLAVVAKRVHEACDELLEAAAERDIVVVSHATPVKLAVAWALGVDIGVTWRSFVDQASVTRIVVRDGRPVLAGFNLLPNPNVR